jgi:hypothetical protein
MCDKKKRNQVYNMRITEYGQSTTFKYSKYYKISISKI